MDKFLFVSSVGVVVIATFAAVANCFILDDASFVVYRTQEQEVVPFNGTMSEFKVNFPGVRRSDIIIGADLKYVGPMLTAVLRFMDGHAEYFRREGEHPNDTHNQLLKALMQLHSDQGWNQVNTRKEMETIPNRTPSGTSSRAPSGKGQPQKKDTETQAPEDDRSIEPGSSEEPEEPVQVKGHEKYELSSKENEIPELLMKQLGLMKGLPGLVEQRPGSKVTEEPERSHPSKVNEEPERSHTSKVTEEPERSHPSKVNEEPERTHHPFDVPNEDEVQPPTLKQAPTAVKSGLKSGDVVE